ncbi:MAG: hypothetical protein UT26_C0012G0015 [Microgenomates group bacterium GW2011_GWC1_39_12]|nr:MAG: hypothetical protein UT26_C0012G0015 [Microgenomates group bacterium GW2011_GWC1_39_12]
MKRLFYYLICFFVCCFLPFSVRAEEIRDFKTTIIVEKDSLMSVSENITYDFGALNRHGIFRTIPITKTNDQGEKFKLDITGIGVEDDRGMPYQMQQSSSSDEMTLKIGDPNKTVTGVHTYIISYTVKGAFVPFSDHDELYWNIVGAKWEVPIQKVKTTIQFPFAPQESGMQLACYTGAYKSTSQGCTISYKNGLVTVFSTSSLSSGEGLSIVIGFPKNLLTITEARKVDTRLSNILGFILSMLFLLAGLGWYVIAPLWIIIQWYRTGRDPKGTVGAAHVWFDVPKLKNGKILTPGETGTLMDETADLRDITATIVDLARRGYIKIIEQKKNDFYLEKITPKKDTGMDEFEKKLYNGIFDEDENIRIKDTDLTSPVTTTKAELYETVVRDGLFPKNPQSQRTLYYIVAGVALFTGNFFLAAVAFLFGRSMPRKTIDGANAANIASALKGFIVSQDRQYKFQAEKQLFFEKMLPYAIIFGVEKIWAERFKNIDIRQPSWYQSYNNNAFTTMYLANSLSHSFSSSVMSAATPTRSSSGFSSGFSSGGGFSGGGGGGGGGGSW